MARKQYKTQDEPLHLPYKFVAREYQRGVRQALVEQGKRRAVCVWHRRAGKDKTFLNAMIPEMVNRVGAYYYYFPTSTMGRDILWEGMDKDGFRFMDHFPAELIARRNEQEMKIEFHNGSLFKIRGTDKREPIGTNPVGVVFSEYSRQNPKVGWDLVRPILAENGGWAIFNFTPRGKNHAYHLFRMAENNPDWFCQKLTVDDTHAIPMSAIEDDRASGMSEEMIRQEYYCDFEIGQAGSFYGRLMSRARDEGRVAHVPLDPHARVFTFWDLGIGDSTAIWFAQFVGKEIHLIDYYENEGEGLSHYANLLQEKQYIYGSHFAPPDSRQRSLQTGRTLLETAHTLGIEFEVVDPIQVEDGIEQARGIFPACWFDKEKCQEGIDCLENYHREYNDKRESFADRPCHDWASHGADAFRYLAVAYKLMSIAGKRMGESQQIVVPVIPKSAYTKTTLRHGFLKAG